MPEVLLPTGRVAAHPPWLGRHQVAGVLQCTLHELERRVEAGWLERMGLQRTWAFDPQAVADLVVQEVDAGRLSPLAPYVLRRLLEDRLEITPPSFDRGTPPSLIRLLDEDSALHSPPRSRGSKGVAAKHAAPSFETRAWLRCVRELLGLPGEFTQQQLSKPFFVIGVAFTPDYGEES